MCYKELSDIWQRVFSLAWESLQHGSKAISAVIVSDTGEIISEGRNRVAERYYPNYIVAHAENEAVMNLDLHQYRHPKEYTLYAGLEPCPMCLGTIVMGHIRHIVIAAKDGHGGAMDLLNQNDFLKSKNVCVEYADPVLGYVQRCLQAIRELVFTRDERSRNKSLDYIRLLHPESVKVAEELVLSGYIDNAIQEQTPFEQVFDTILEKLAAEQVRY